MGLRQRLEAILTRSQHASPGPWRWERVLFLASIKSESDNAEVASVDYAAAEYQAPLDAEFIATAREDLPATTKALLRIVDECEGPLRETHPHIARRLLDAIEEEIDL